MGARRPVSGIRKGAAGTVHVPLRGAAEAKTLHALGAQGAPGRCGFGLAKLDVS